MTILKGAGTFFDSIELLSASRTRDWDFRP